MRDTAVKTWKIFASLWQEKSFYQFLAFMTLVVGVRSERWGQHETSKEEKRARQSSHEEAPFVIWILPVVPTSSTSGR